MTASQRQMDKTFFALSDCTRRGILAQLSRGSSRVGDLARPYKMSAPAISRLAVAVNSACRTVLQQLVCSMHPRWRPLTITLTLQLTGGDFANGHQFSGCAQRPHRTLRNSKRKTLP